MDLQYCPTCSSLLAGLNGMKACLACSYYEPADAATATYPPAPQLSLQSAAAMPSPTTAMNGWAPPIPSTHMLPEPSQELLAEIFGNRDQPAAETIRPAKRRRRVLKSCIVLLALGIIGTAGLFGYGEMTAVKALRTAKPQIQNGQYQAALLTLSEVNTALTFGSVREEVRAATSKADRWAYQQALLTQADLLIKDGKYQEALDLLKGVTPDFPGYGQARTYILQAGRQLAN